MESNYELTELNTYIFGFGKVGMASGCAHTTPKDKRKKKQKWAFIKLSQLDESFEIAQDIRGVECSESNFTHLMFSNVESLEALQTAINNCRRILTEKP